MPYQAVVPGKSDEAQREAEIERRCISENYEHVNLQIILELSGLSEHYVIGKLIDDMINNAETYGAVVHAAWRIAKDNNRVVPMHPLPRREFTETIKQLEAEGKIRLQSQDPAVCILSPQVHLLVIEGEATYYYVLYEYVEGGGNR